MINSVKRRKLLILLSVSLLSFVLAFMMMTRTAVSADTSYGVQNINVTLSDSLDINFYVKVPDSATTENAELKVDLLDHVYTLTGTVDDAENKIYKYTFSEVTPQLMTATFSAQLVVSGENSGDAYEKTLEEYFIALTESNVFDYTDAKFSALRALVADIIAYGRASQDYLDYDTENKPAEMTSWQTAWTSAPTSILDGANSEYVDWDAANIEFGNNISVQVKFTLKNYTPSDLNVKVSKGGGVAQQIACSSLGGNNYVASFNAITPLEFDDALVFTVYDGEDAISNALTYSVNSYVNRKYNSENAIGSLAKRLYLYGESAQNFVDANNDKTVVDLTATSLGDVILNQDTDAYVNNYTFNVALPESGTLETITSYGITGSATKLDMTKLTQVGNTITFDNAYIRSLLGVLDGGDLYLSLYSNNYQYNVKVLVVSINITTKAGLTAFAENYFKYYHTVTGIYATLGADIDYENEELQAIAGFTSTTDWSGTFDGRGHTIYRITIRHGFLPVIGSSGVIKNVGFARVIKTENGTGIIANQNYGTIDNCFVQGNMYMNGTFANTNYGTISNSFAIVSTTYSTIYAIARTNSGTISKVYSIVTQTGSNTIYAYDTETTGAYATVSAYTADSTKDFSGFNNEYWNTFDTTNVKAFDYWYDNSNYLVDKTAEDYTYLLSRNNGDTIVLDLSKVDSDITSNAGVNLLRGISKLAASASGVNSLSISTSILPVANEDWWFTVSTPAKDYKVKIFVCDYALSQSDTAVENSVVKFKTLITNNPSWYFALSEDITFSTAFSPILPAVAAADMSSKTPFSGTFNGLGHKMTGINISPVDTTNGGAFSCATVIGYNTGTIKNVYVEMRTANSSNGIGFVGLNYGNVQNVYSKVTIVLDKTSGRGQVGAVVAANRAGGTISNCVGEIVLGTGVTHMFGIGTVCGTNYASAYANINRCYGIAPQAVEYGTRGATVTYTNTANNVYALNSAVYVGGTGLTDADFSSANGWASYWTTSGGHVYFNGTQIA